MEVKINKEIRNYTESMFFGLSLRQFVFSVLACGVAVGLYFMMRVFGYDDTTCSRYILGAYRPISYIGFAIGTLYQYGLLRLMVSVVFEDIENVPEYSFDFKALTVTLILFVFTYELVMYLYSRSIKRLSVKSVMME